MPEIFSHPYSQSSISSTSQSEEFKRGLNIRDGIRCIVCGIGGSVVEHCHIVPKSDHSMWNDLRNWGVVPQKSKNVDIEIRNGIKMCRNHQGSFDIHQFYIRWMPSERRFILINHSRARDLEKYHGRAVRLYPDDPRTPFCGAFLNQEMRVRGRYPYQKKYRDRPIVLPIQWQQWIRDAPDLNPGGSWGDSEDDAWGNYLSAGRLGAIHWTNAHISSQPALHQPPTQEFCRQQEGSRENMTGTPPTPAKSTITFTDPMANPEEYELLMRAARQEPNWRATIIEGETWDGTTEENIAHYLRVMPPFEG